ncbi:hypothetical protein MASR2M69_13210 [Bacteroidota bacterium]
MKILIVQYAQLLTISCENSNSSEVENRIAIAIRNVSTEIANEAAIRAATFTKLSVRNLLSAMELPLAIELSSAPFGNAAIARRVITIVAP